MTTTPTEGAVYHDKHSENLVECINSPSTVGMPTHEAEHVSVRFRTIEDGDTYSMPADNYGPRHFEYVADSVDEVEA